MSTQQDATAAPRLYIRRGRTLIEVTPVQASRLMAAKRGTGGQRTVRDIPLHDIDGNQIGAVSFNGRVWLGKPGRERGVEIPLPGVKTAAQCEAEGWR